MTSTNDLSVTEILNQFTIDEVILWLNAQNIQDWFICYGCCELTRGEPFELFTTEFGDQQTFCTTCVRYCDTCGVNFAPSMAYFHDDCNHSE
jgi:hypothetical protein